MPFIRPVIGGGTAAPTVWEYASLAIAEASGDPWVDNDDILITAKVTYKYRSDLVVSGYSGLIHKDPYDDASLLTGAAVIGSEAAGLDPDTAWVSGWTPTLTGTWPVIDVQTTRSRIGVSSGSNNSAASIASFQRVDVELRKGLSPTTCPQAHSASNQASKPAQLARKGSVCRWGRPQASLQV